MSVPGSNAVQFVPTGGNFYVDSITDPGGAPASILDVDLGLVVSGRVILPNWLTGKGQVCVYADELGGPIDERLQPCAQIDIKGKTGEPGSTTYPWKISFPGTVLPDPSPGSQLYRLAAVFLLRRPGDRHRVVRRDGHLPHQLSGSPAGALGTRPGRRQERARGGTMARRGDSHGTVDGTLVALVAGG